MDAADNHKYRRTNLTKPLIFGIIAGVLLMSVYFVVLTILNSFNHALDQFTDLWYWMILLVVGFGFQVGLYTYIRVALKVRQMTGAATSSVAAAGGISTTSMIACCAHHLTDVIPILGISAAALFLNRFQILFIVIGLLSNLIGLNMMLKIIQEHKLYDKRGFLGIIMKLDMKQTLYFNIPFCVVLFLIVLFVSL